MGLTGFHGTFNWLPSATHSLPLLASFSGLAEPLLRSAWMHDPEHPLWRGKPALPTWLLFGLPCEEFSVKIKIILPFLTRGCPSFKISPRLTFTGPLVKSRTCSQCWSVLAFAVRCAFRALELAVFVCFPLVCVA